MAAASRRQEFIVACTKLLCFHAHFVPLEKKRHYDLIGLDAAMPLSTNEISLRACAAYYKTEFPQLIVHYWILEDMSQQERK